MTIDEITNDIHIALDWHAPTGPCHHGQMMAAEKQTGHQLISNNHTESAMTTMSHGPFYAIHIYITWQPLNKLCWERIRGSTTIGFCVIAGPFFLSDDALWQVQLLLQSGCLGLLLATELLNHKRELHHHPLKCIKYIHIILVHYIGIYT